MLQTDNHASTPPLSFLPAGCPSCHPTNSVKALKDNCPANHLAWYINSGHTEQKTSSASYVRWQRGTARICCCAKCCGAAGRRAAIEHCLLLAGPTAANLQQWQAAGEWDGRTHTHYAGTHTHTHPFNGPFSGTTRVSRYQKSKTNLDFTEARDSEWQWHQLGHMQVCISLQTENHASTPLLSFFTGRMPFLPPNQQRQSTEGKALNSDSKINFWWSFLVNTLITNQF